MDKNEILYRLYKSDVMRKAHDEMLTGLVANLRDEYIGKSYLEVTDSSLSLEFPFFKNVVNMFLSLFFTYFAENIIEQIAEIIAGDNPQPLGTKE